MIDKDFENSASRALRAEKLAAIVADEISHGVGAQPKVGFERVSENGGATDRWSDQAGNRFEVSHGPDRTVHRMNGAPHRVGGPAIEWKTGALEWWHKGAVAAYCGPGGSFDLPVDKSTLQGPLNAMETSKIMRSQDRAHAQAEETARNGAAPPAMTGDTFAKLQKWRAARTDASQPMLAAAPSQPSAPSR